MKFSGAILLLVLMMAMSGCASLTKPHNEPLNKIDDQVGYRIKNVRDGEFGDHLIFLAFSGGGTRAAALSYGVLQELRDTQVDSRGSRVRLLDEVDTISSVSGGSFTAAYYGLFGDKLFSEYEKVFLRQSIQGALIRKLFDPVYWWESLFSGLDRTEMAIEYYGSNIFEDKTFSDINLKKGPFIEINATDLGGSNRFSFGQGVFDLICSDLGQLSVARAVTASSAVPIAFPTVVLKNYAGECDSSDSIFVRSLANLSSDNPRIKQLKDRVKSFTDAKARPFIHLVDGGLADNLGLRALLDRVETFAGHAEFFERSKQLPKDMLVILVNAEVKPERSIDQSASKPSVIETLNALSDVQISLYNDETKMLLPKKLGEFLDLVKARGRGHDMNPYIVEVSFESIQKQSIKSYFNSLPTSLELSDRDVDMLIAAGRDLLRKSPQYQSFLTQNNAGEVPSVTRLEDMDVPAKAP